MNRTDGRVRASALAGRLATSLIAGLAVCLAGCGRLAEHPLVVVAGEEARANARVAEALGKPVKCGTSIRGTANETDGIAALQFDVTGPSGTGVVIVEGKKTRGEWGVTHLELRSAGGGSLLLTSDLEARVGVDTPAFDPDAKPAAPSGVPPPPRDIEIALPPGPPGQ